MIPKWFSKHGSLQQHYKRQRWNRCWLWRSQLRCLWKCRLMIWWAKYWVLKYFVAVSVYATANHWIFFFWLRWYILQCGYDLRKVKELWNDFEYVCKIQMVKALVLACVVCLSLSTQEHGLCSRVMFQESLINGH